MDGNSIQTTVTQFAWLLVGATVLGMLARRIRVPYAVALVIGGLIVAESGIANVPHLSPTAVLFVFLPPLLFDAAFRIDARELRLVLRPVLILAVPGTLVTAIAVGAILWAVLGLRFPVAFLFGSIVAATDPVAVISVFKQMHAPERVATIAEAESLINDGMAITLYTAAVDLVVRGEASPLGIGRLLVQEIGGGIAVGVATGLVVAWLTKAVDDRLIEMTMSTALAYGSYLIANAIGGSGPLACVAAGLVHGTYGRRIGMTAETRQALDDLWEYIGFVANAVVFLLVGLTVNLRDLWDDIWPAVIAIVAVLLARVLVIEAPLVAIPRPKVITSAADRTVLIWAGLRGALTIALALALPPGTASRTLLIAMAFGVVLFTLLVQGLTLRFVLQRVGLVEGM